MGTFRWKSIHGFGVAPKIKPQSKTTIFVCFNQWSKGVYKWISSWTIQKDNKKNHYLFIIIIVYEIDIRYI